MLFGKVVGRLKGVGECKLAANLRVKQRFLILPSLEVLKIVDGYLYMPVVCFRMIKLILLVFVFHYFF